MAPPVSVSMCVRSEPIRDASALLSGPPRNLAVGEALPAQSFKRGEYFLTGLSVLQAGSAVLCRSTGDRIFGENGSDMGVAINAHLFLDRRPEILDQMKTVSHLAGLRCALPGRLGIRPQRSRLTTSIVGRSCNHAFALSTLRSSKISTTD